MYVHVHVHVYVYVCAHVLICVGIICDAMEAEGEPDQLAARRPVSKPVKITRTQPTIQRRSLPHTINSPCPIPPPCLSPFVSLSRLPLERSTHSFYGDSNAIFQQCGRWPGQGHVEGEGERSGGAAAGTGGAAAGLSQGPSPLLRVSIGDASLRSIICVEYRYLSIYLLACGQLDV